MVHYDHFWSKVENELNGDGSQQALGATGAGQRALGNRGSGQGDTLNAGRAEPRLAEMAPLVAAAVGHLPGGQRLCVGHRARGAGAIQGESTSDAGWVMERGARGFNSAEEAGFWDCTWQGEAQVFTYFKVKGRCHPL